MTYDPFLASLPYVNPFSGIVTTEYGTGVAAAVEVLFTSLIETEDGDVLIVDDTYILPHRIKDTVSVIGICDMADITLAQIDIADIARSIVLYHAAEDYCKRLGMTVAEIFPAIDRDYHRLGLDDETAFYAREAGYKFSKSKDTQRLLLEVGNPFHAPRLELEYDYEEFRKI